VLPLVVGRPAAIETLAIARRAPGTHSLGPALLHAEHDVTVPVAEHGGQLAILDASGEQNWALALERIVVHPRLKAHGRESGRHLGFEVAIALDEGALVRKLLALGPDRHAPGKVALEPAVIDVGFGAGDGMGHACYRSGHLAILDVPLYGFASIA